MGRFLLALALLSVMGLSGGMFWYTFTQVRPNSAPLAASHNEETRPLTRSPAASPVGKCMNMGNALEAPKEGDWGYKIRHKDLLTLKRAGFDTVRIPVKWSAHARKDAPYALSPETLKRLDQVIRQANNAGLNVIINVHHYDEISINANKHLPRLYGIWDQLISHYRNAPDTVMFEFLNEPHTSMSASRVNEMNREILKRVRAVSPERWVVLGGGQWGTLDGLLATNPPYDERAIVTFHYYDPFEFTHQGAPWAHKKVPLGQKWGSRSDRQKLANDFARAARWRDQVGMPLLLGEFGVYEAVPNIYRAEWTERVRRTSEEVDFGWCYWEFGAGMGVYDTTTDTWRPGMLESLTQ